MDDQESALKLWVVMNRAVRAIEAPLRRQVEAHGISFTEFAVLEALLHKGPMPIGDIGERVLLTSGSMTYVVDKLVKRGLVERRACESDRRVVYGDLTAAGRSLISPVFSEHAVLLAETMAGLSPAEREVTAGMLKRLGRHAQETLRADPVSS